MIPLQEFDAAVSSIIKKLNAPQNNCVLHAPVEPLMIVAGPGSGKTTVLVLRALRHALVDGMAPSSIMITTFTRKAAGELSSRLIDWGLQLVAHFRNAAATNGDLKTAAWLEQLDIVSIRTGTLDSFCQEWLGRTRQVGSPSPVMLEQFAADFVYRRRIFSPVYQVPASKDILGTYLGQFSFDGLPPTNETRASRLSIQVNNRLIQDLVDVASYEKSSPACRLQAQMLASYRALLNRRQMYDFALAAERVLESLRSGHLYAALDNPISALLVDEYQDTNPLQEAIYFELIKNSKAALSIVGDDDQALYRFRGATVELFTNFQTRLAKAIAGTKCRVEYLLMNHRSTPPIVSFFNNLATYDPAFAAARVAGKPLIQPFNQGDGLPIIGMFRPDLDVLAADLSHLLTNAFQGNGWTSADGKIALKGSASGGALGDALLLAHSVSEYKEAPGGGLGERLPAKLRHLLSAQRLGVFNPRGQELRDIPNVGILLGLVLLCIDPVASIQDSLQLTRDARRYLPQWRAVAEAFVRSGPQPCTAKGSLATYIEDWGNLRNGSGQEWPADVPLLDLLYKLIVWMPEFQRDPEHQIYLEAIMRCVAQGAHYSSYSFRVLKAAQHSDLSRAAVIRDLLVPVAEDVVEVDEDLLYAVPRNRLSIMTIHQSKGLEYPLVIVDVGSEFKMNHPTQSFRRFPRKASNTVLMESSLATHTEVGAFRTARTDLDRTFDDLMRLYYVAYSRPQAALLLVGLTKSLEYATKIQNIATFWSRSGDWNWRKDNPPLKKGFPPMPENVPFIAI